VLIARHTYRRRKPWGLPAGWVQHGEDPAQAVVREVAEETGYIVEVGPPIAVGMATDPSHVDLAFLCRLIGGDFRPCAEISAARFVDLNEAERLLPWKDMAHVRAGIAWRSSAMPHGWASGDAATT
jgi:ADP-ribose pyrophosphatase YjhB (NUDIX family)